MHIKYRKGLAALYRSEWVKKGAEGNSHGFSRQVFIGSLPADCETVPVELLPKLTADELEMVKQKILIPAETVRLAKEAEETKRRVDPSWRLEEAARLVKEAAALSAPSNRVPDWRIRAVASALETVVTFGDSTTPLKRSAPADPLADALTALKAASHAVAKGHYGRAKEGAARNSAIYKTWTQISAQIAGDAGSESLLRALQTMGWVKVRGGHSGGS